MPVEVVELVVCCVLVVVVVVVEEAAVVFVVADAIAVFASNTEAKYNTPFVHDNDCATVRLATGKSALPPVAVVRFRDVVFVFFNTAYPQEFTLPLAR